MTDELEAALAATSGWSKPSTFAATGVHHGYRQVTLVSGGRRTAAAEPWAAVLDRYEPVRNAWLSWIDPGGYILPHRDASPWLERWQLPIRPAGSGLTGPAGEAFRVFQWETHQVANDSNRPRIHLVVDRDVLAHVGSAPFQKA